MIQYFFINLKTLFEQGKEFQWQKPERCPNPQCNSKRLWKHSFVERCFKGFHQKLWIRKYRCPDCKSVHTLRPATHSSRFHYRGFIILRCLLNKINRGRWRPSVARQNQQYWWKGLVKQASRFINVKNPLVEHIKLLLRKKINPVTHSNYCEILRI